MASRATAAAADAPRAQKGRLGKIGKRVADVFRAGASSAQRRLSSCRAAVKAVADASEGGVSGGAIARQTDAVNSLKLALSSSQLLSLLGENDDELRSSCGELIGVLGAYCGATRSVYTAWLDDYVNGIDFESEDTDLYVVLTVLETAKAFVDHSNRTTVAAAAADTNGEGGTTPPPRDARSRVSNDGEDHAATLASAGPASSAASIVHARLPLSTSCVVYRACCLVIEELGEGYLLSPVLELGTQLCLELHVVSETGATDGLDVIEHASPAAAVDGARERDLLPDADGHAFLDLVDLLIGR